jgi:hypothetical protein
MFTCFVTEEKVHLYGQGTEGAPLWTRNERCTSMSKEGKVHLYGQGTEGTPL